MKHKTLGMSTEIWISYNFYVTKYSFDYLSIKKCKKEFSSGTVVRLSIFTARAWIQSLVGKLRPCKPHKKTNKIT